MIGQGSHFFPSTGLIAKERLETTSQHERFHKKETIKVIIILHEIGLWVINEDLPPC